jgi:cytochrome P450
VTSVTAGKLTQGDIPMAFDRADGWSFVRAKGRVVPVDGVLWISHRDDVEYVLRTPEIFSSQKAFDMIGSPLPLVPIAFDPPKHTDYRKILQPFFSPRALAAMLPSLQAQITDLIDAIAAKGECDVVPDLAVPYPSQVFLTLFGLPLEDRERLIAWKDVVIALSGGNTNPAEADLGPALELFAYLTEAINAKRANPGDDVLSALLTGEDALDDAEAIGLSFLFVLAGLDTVTGSIGFALEYLARRPDLRALINTQPDKIPDLVEEIVRLEPPAPTVPRVTTQDTEIGGTHIPAGTLLYVCVGAANRDPGTADENPAADSVDTDREVKRHWGFGGGPHRCLGSHLARMELRLVLEEWHRRIPEYELAPGAEPHITWPANTFSLESLPLVFPKSPSRS